MAIFIGRKRMKVNVILWWEDLPVTFNTQVYRNQIMHLYISLEENEIFIKP